MIILSVAIVLTATVSAFVLTRPVYYSATTSLLLSPLPGNPLVPTISNAQQVTIAMNTEAGVVTSPAVTQQLNQRFPIEMPVGTASLVASAPANTQIVQIEYTSTTAQKAAEGANAYGKAYLEHRLALAELGQKQQLDSLNAQLKSAKDSLARVNKAAAAPAASADASTNVQIYTSQVAALQDRIGQSAAPNGSPGIVIDPATAPSGPTGLKPLWLIAAAALLGLLTGAVIAIWRERSDDRIRSTSDQQVASMPILASIPGERKQGPALVSSRSADDPWTIAYRRGRTGVVALAPAPTTIVMSGDDGLAPVVRVTANLALSLASAGYRVTMVDASLEQDPSNKLLDRPDGPNFAAALIGPSFDEAMVQFGGVRLLPAGPDPHKARELVGGKRLTSLMHELRRDADYVLVAAAPATTPEGMAVAIAGDALVLVVTDRVSTRQHIEDVAMKNRGLGVNMLGLICVSSGLHHRNVVEADVVGAEAHQNSTSPSLQSSLSTVNKAHTPLGRRDSRTSMDA